MSERYCFYCGNQLGLKEVCQCRQRKQAHAKYEQTASTNTAETTGQSKPSAKTKQSEEAAKQSASSKQYKTSWQAQASSKEAKLNLLQATFSKLKESILSLFKRLSYNLKQSFANLNVFRLRNSLLSNIRSCLFPASAYSSFANFKPATSLFLAALSALLVALNFHFLLTNSTLGRIISLYLTPVIATKATYNAGLLFIKVALLTYLLFLAKVLLYRYIFAAWRKALSFSEALKIVNASLVYALIFSLLSLGFANSSPVQFILVTCLGQGLTFYLEAKAVSAMQIHSEDKVVILLLVANFVLIALTAFLIRAFIPEFMIFKIA